MVTADKTKAILTFAAIGDALGSPLDGLKGGRIQQLFGGRVEHYPDPDTATDGKSHRRRLQGVHGYATQQILLVADVLLEQSGWDDTAALEHVRAFTTPLSDAPHGLFRTSDPDLWKLFKHIERPETWNESLRMTAPHVGAMTRAIPLALWYGDAPEDLIRHTVQSVQITHTHPDAVFSAVALGAAIAQLARAADEGGHIDAVAIAESIHDVTCQAESLCAVEGAADSPLLFSSATMALPGLLREARDDLARTTLLSEANRHHPPYPIKHLTQPFPVVLGPALIYRALSARSPMDALIQTINEGYASATSGAILGALLGARFGLEGIEPEWIDDLQSAALIAARAHALSEREIDWTWWEDLAEAERNWTAQENQERQALMDAQQQALEKRGKSASASRKTAAGSRETPTSSLRPTPAPSRTAPDAEEYFAHPDAKKRERRERKLRDKQRDQERGSKRSRRADFMARGPLAFYEDDEE